MIKKAEIITILAGFLIVYITDSAKAVINDVQITPDEPTTEDIIAVVTFGTESSRPVKVIDTDVNITDSEIDLDLTLFIGPFFMITDWSYSVDIGRLSAGTYDLTVRIIVDSDVKDSYFTTFQVVPAPPMTLDGSGTEQDPWRIKSLEDFNDFAADPNYWAGFTRLETDVNLSGQTYTTAVIAPDTDNSNYPFDGTAFTGVFDGNNNTIINLTIDDGGAGNDFVGLFGCIIGGQVRNLGLEGGLVSGDRRVGGLVGSGSGISNCYSKCDVDGFMAVGGLVGVNEYGSISNSHSTGNISGSGGGLVGYNYFGSISNCYSIGSVSGGDVVGGLVGTNGSGTVSNSYSTSYVSGGGFIGGLVGHNTLLADISNCYSTGDVSGLEWIGGLVGWNDYSTVSNCFWDTDTQIHAVTASIGDNDYGTVTNVAGLPTLKMQIRSTFTDADWDFINVWNIGENQTYPYLRVYLPSDINKDGIVNFLDLSITANKWLQEQ